MHPWTRSASPAAVLFALSAGTLSAGTLAAGT
jgi:hypothetical protein